MRNVDRSPGPGDDLPLDSDTDVDTDTRVADVDSDTHVAEGASGRPRPVHLHWRFIGLVFVGGAAGTAAREWLTLVIPTVGSLPIATVGINVLGALLLGALLEALVRRGPDEAGRRTLRLLLGTGFLGGFTTYSTLATDTSLLVGFPGIPTAVLYSIGTLVLGAIATWTGIAVTAKLHRQSAENR